MEWKTVTVHSVSINKDVMRLQLTPRVFDFKPGQFAILRFPSQQLHRAYSIASSPLEQHYTFYIKLVNGAFTSQLAHVKEGEKLEIAGPFGHMCLEEQPTLTLSGGVGITPFLSMLRHHCFTKRKHKLIVMNSVKYCDDVTWLKDVEELGECGKRCYVQFVTRQRCERWRTGRIGKEVIEDVIKQFKQQCKVFICGSKVFADAMLKILDELGVEKNNIAVESWG